tara:strand:+ start:327 stop:698 length:372 start_codon:yes stop_codon:yes gene_type:complete
MRGGSPAYRAVMSQVKTDSANCNERFVATANTHDVSGGDFYATTGGAYRKQKRKGTKRKKGKGKKTINFRELSVMLGRKRKKTRGKGKKVKGRKSPNTINFKRMAVSLGKNGGGSHPTPPVFY